MHNCVQMCVHMHTHIRTHNTYDLWKWNTKREFLNCIWVKRKIKNWFGNPISIYLHAIFFQTIHPSISPSIQSFAETYIQMECVFLHSFLFFSLLLYQGRVSLCSPDLIYWRTWPQTQISTYLCFPSAGIKSIHYHCPAYFIFWRIRKEALLNLQSKEELNSFGLSISPHTAKNLSEWIVTGLSSEVSKITHQVEVFAA